MRSVGGKRRRRALLLVVFSAAVLATPVVGQTPEKPKPAAKAAGRPPAVLKPLTQEQQTKLLRQRLDGRMGGLSANSRGCSW